MKKLFLVALAAGMFVACGNKTNEEATEEVVEEVVETPAPAVEEPAPAAEPVVAEEKAEPAVKVEANEDGAKVKVGDKAEISVQPKQTKGNNF